MDHFSVFICLLNIAIGIGGLLPLPRNRFHEGDVVFEKLLILIQSDNSMRYSTAHSKARFHIPGVLVGDSMLLNRQVKTKKMCLKIFTIMSVSTFRS